MGCKCNETPCTGIPDCTCPVKDLSTDCVLYTGDDLECSGIQKDTLLTNVIKALDEFICNKFDDVLKYLSLINVGNGAVVFKGINGIGQKEIKSIVSEDLTLLDIVVNTDTIGLKPGVPSMTHVSDIVRFIVTTAAGATEFANLDLSAYNYDTFVQSASFDYGTGDITIVRNNSEPDIVFSLMALDKYVTSGAYSSDTITLTLKDAATVDIDVSTLVSEILSAAASAQVQSDYLEASSGSKAFIVNKNPSKSETLGVAATYTVVTADNNKIIEIDNGSNDVTISVGALSETTEFFVGFVQKGTGEVQFTGYDISPAGLGDKIFGQGHAVSLEIINSTKYIHGTLKS